MLSLAIPTALFNLLRKFTEIINVIYVGSLHDNSKLAGVGMGNMIQNLCAMSIILGCNSALDTLIS